MIILNTHTNRIFIFVFSLCCFFIYGCITRFEATGVVGVNNILVVEGIITDDISTFRLSKTVGLNEYLFDTAFVNHAMLYVECDDGAVSEASQFAEKGTYLIETGDLHPDKKYRLLIYLDGEAYRSEFLKPLITPDFDLSHERKENGARNSIQVSTLDTAHQSAFYLWTYKEDWEFTARLKADSFCINYEWVYHDLYSPDNRYYCWKKDSSRIFILGNGEKMINHEIKNHEILSRVATSERFSLLYHIAVKQYMIRKEAYLYYNNLQKNVKNTGGIFSIIPAEIPGNLYCHTSPKLPVIGYVEVSTTKEQKRFLTHYESYIHDINLADCIVFYPNPQNPPKECENSIQQQWVVFNWASEDGSSGVLRKWFYQRVCVDCVAAGGTKNKPSWWPTDHL